ncbi:MAG TPA: transposase [Tepidisphaeraceae bacterium]
MFTVWSVARLGTYLHRRTGIAIGTHWLRRLLHREVCVVGRPKHTLANKRDGISADKTPVGTAKRGGPSERVLRAVVRRRHRVRPAAHLVRGWMPKARQPAVKMPGKNKRLAAFGPLRYGGGGRGPFLRHTQLRDTAWGMRHLVQRLLHRARHTGRRIVLVLDRGNPNHAHALHRDFELAEPHIKVIWLPKYSWNLNLIERLWKHIKGSRVANVLFASYRQFVRHVQATLEDFAQHPDLTLSIAPQKAMKYIHRNLSVGTDTIRRVDDGASMSSKLPNVNASVVN